MNRFVRSARRSHGQARKSRGFTLVEFMIVLMMLGLASAFAYPKARNMLIGSRVEPVAKDIINVTNAMRTQAAANGSATPYTTLGAAANATAVFANTARSKASTLTASGAGATSTVTHSLGATSAAITVASNTITTAGDSFAVTVADTAKGACPDLGTQLAKFAESITINGTSVKAVGGTYNGATAENACTDDDNNDWVFVFR